MIIKEKNLFFVNSAIKLLGSGVISSLGFILFSSNTFEFIEFNIVIDLLIILQIHTIGLTITKLSYDSISYSHYINNPNIKPKVINFILRKSLILALPIFVFSIYRFNILIAVLVFINVLLDQYSNLIVNQLNFRHLFKPAFILNFMSYPLLFITIIFISYIINIDLKYYVIIFSICLFFKSFTSFIYYKNILCEIEIDLIPKWNMGFQQILNYILFKSDTIIISLPLVIVTSFNINKSEILEVLYLSRFPELVSGITLSLSVLYYPRYIFENGRELFKLINLKELITYLLFTLIFYWVFLLFWKHSKELQMHNIVFYFLNGFLVIFCNLISFNLIKIEKYSFLFYNLMISCFVGVLFFFINYVIDLNFVFAIVPLQMVIFILFFIFKFKHQQRNIFLND